MAFYNTQNPSKFVRQNESDYTSQHVQFLRSGFQQCNSIDHLSDIDGSNHQYTAAELLNRFIVRTNNNMSTDVLPTAKEIIDALKAQQDIRALAQDAKSIAPRRGFYFDVCFSAPSTEGFYQYAIVSPNMEYQLDPSVDGVLTITNCLGSSQPVPPGFPIIFVQGGLWGEGWFPQGNLIWVRFTLVNVTEGSLQVNASVLTNNCYMEIPGDLAAKNSGSRIMELVAEMKKSVKA